MSSLQDHRADSGKRPARRFLWAVLPPLLAAALLFAVTEIPYAAGRAADRPGESFDGLIANSEDIHAYFSFARQSAEGRWLFENRYALESHTPAFFNSEWLVVGWGTRLFGDRGVFVAWRAVGILLLASGFWALSTCLVRRFDRIFALALFAFGGGFGWVLQATHGLRALGPAPKRIFGSFLYADQSWGVQPFVQALHNPHFTVVHGLVLIALALLAAAERSRRPFHYAAAGFVALLVCTTRPYEIFVFLAVLPALHLLSGDVTDVRSLSRRALTLAALLPSLLLLVVLGRDPNFHTWSKNIGMPVVPIAGTLVLLGPTVFALVARILVQRRLPVGNPAERVMSLWCGAVLLLSQINRVTDVLPFGSQVLITMMGPLVLLAVPFITGSLGMWRVSFAVGFFLLALPSSAVVLRRRTEEARTFPSLYVSDGEREGWEWLAREARTSDLILASTSSGNRLPRHVSAHVVAGHWVWTPFRGSRDAETRAFFGGGMSRDATAEYVRRLGVDWIWVGPAEQKLGAPEHPDFGPGIELRYDRLGVRIYRCAG